MCLRARIPDSLRLAKHNFNDAFFLASQRCFFVKSTLQLCIPEMEEIWALEIIIFQILGFDFGVGVHSVLNILE